MSAFSVRPSGPDVLLAATLGRSPWLERTASAAASTLKRMFQGGRGCTRSGKQVAPAGRMERAPVASDYLMRIEGKKLC